MGSLALQALCGSATRSSSATKVSLVDDPIVGLLALDLKASGVSLDPLDTSLWASHMQAIEQLLLRKLASRIWKAYVPRMATGKR